MRGVLGSIFFALVLLAGCGGESGGGSADLRVVDYNLNYNDDRTQISGSIVVSAAGLVVETDYQRELVLENFLASVSGCRALASGVVNPESVTLADAAHTQLGVTLDFEDACSGNSLAVSYDKTYRLTRDEETSTVYEQGLELGTFAIDSDVLDVQDDEEAASTVYQIIRSDSSKLEQNQSTSLGW